MVALCGIEVFGTEGAPGLLSGRAFQDEIYLWDGGRLQEDMEWRKLLDGGSILETKSDFCAGRTGS